MIIFNSKYDAIENKNISLELICLLYLKSKYKFLLHVNIRKRPLYITYIKSRIRQYKTVIDKIIHIGFITFIILLSYIM
jgi:hypothetical protein